MKLYMIFGIKGPHSDFIHKAEQEGRAVLSTHFTGLPCWNFSAMKRMKQRAVVMALTATATPDMQKRLSHFLNNPVLIKHLSKCSQMKF